MMDDFRRPLDGNSCPMLGGGPKISSGFSSIVSHLDLFRFLNRTNESVWPLESTWIPIWRTKKKRNHSAFFFLYTEPSFVTKESNMQRSNKVPYWPLINREGMEKWLWGVWFEVLKMGCISWNFIKALKKIDNSCIKWPHKSLKTPSHV